MHKRDRSRRRTALAVLALALGAAPIPGAVAAEAVRAPEIRVVSADEARISSIRAQRASGDFVTVDGRPAYDPVDAVDIGAAEAARAAAAVVPEQGLTLHRRIVVRIGSSYGVKDLYTGLVPGRGAAVLHDVTPTAAGTLLATRLYRVDAVRVDAGTIRATRTGPDGGRTTADVPAGPTDQCGMYSSDVCEIVIPPIQWFRGEVCDYLDEKLEKDNDLVRKCYEADQAATDAEEEECSVAPGGPYECEYGKAFITLHGCNSGYSCTASGHGVTGAASNQSDFADLIGTWYYPCLSEPGLTCSATSSDPLYDLQVTDPGGAFTFSGAVFTGYDRAVCEATFVDLQVMFWWTDLSGQVNPPSHQFTTRSAVVRTGRVPPVNDPACA